MQETQRSDQAIHSDSGLLGESKLRELYVKGVFRNVMLLLTNAHPELTTHKNTDGGRSRPNRGAVSYGLLVHLFQTTTFKRITERFFLSNMKSTKQGEASWHDLGLAHCLFCSIENEICPNSNKRDLTVTRTQTFGRIIQPLRVLTANVYSNLDVGQLSDLSEDKIMEMCPIEAKHLQQQLKAALALMPKFRTSNRRNDSATNDENTNSSSGGVAVESWFVLSRMVKHYALLIDCGLDRRSFDSFLVDEE